MTLFNQALAFALSLYTARTPHFMMLGVSLLVGILYLLWTKSMLAYFIFITLLLVFGIRPPQRWVQDVAKVWSSRPWLKAKARAEAGVKMDIDAATGECTPQQAR